jgi:hypothetical protein
MDNAFIANPLFSGPHVIDALMLRLTAIHSLLDFTIKHTSEQHKELIGILNTLSDYFRQVDILGERLIDS